MAEIAFDGAKVTGRLASLAVRAECVAHPRHFDRIAERGSGSMGLKIAQLIRLHSGRTPRGTQQSGLLLWIRNSQPASLPSVIASRPFQNGIDPIAISSRRGERFEHHHDGALGADVAIGLCREGLATPLWREHARLVVGDRRPWVADDVDAPDQCLFTGAGTQRLHRFMNRNQRA